MNDKTNKQLNTQTTTERSLVANDLIFNNLQSDKESQVLDLIIENKLRKDKDGKNYMLHLNPSEKYTDEQIEALQYLFATKSFEVIIDPGEPETEFFADKTLDTLLFIAALTCPSHQRDDIVGHLMERYGLDVKRHGEQKAKILLGKDVVSSWLPNTQDTTRAKIVKMIVKLGLEIILKHFFG
jgi:hypothetical protein